MLQLLQAFGGPGRTALSFAPTYSMYPEYARDTDHRVGRRAPRGRLLARPRPRARPDRGAAAERRAAALARTTRPAPRCRPRRSPRCARPRPERAGRHRRGRRGVRRVPPRRARRARSSCCREHRNLVVTPHHEQGVRAGRRPARATSPPTPEICDAIRVVRLPYHLSAVTQAVALAALRHAPELLGRVDELRAERDATVAWLRGAGARGRRQRRQLRAVRDLRGPARCLAGAARPGRADPGGRPRRVAAGVDRHRGRDGGVQSTH